MQDALQELERLVSDLVHPETSTPKNITSEWLKKYHLILKDEIKRQERELLLKSSCCKSEPANTYVSRYLQAVVIMADGLYEFITRTTKGPKSQTKVIYGGIYEVLENFYHYLLKSFPADVDHRIKIPNSYKEKLIPEFKRTLLDIERSFKKLGIEERLKKIFIQPFESFFNNDYLITLQSLLYINELTRISKLNHTRDSLIGEMIAINFNSVQFFNYYIETVKAAAAVEKTNDELIIYWTYQIKIINQIIPVSEIGLKPALPHIRQQLAGWMGEEIYYQEKKREFNTLEAGLRPPITSVHNKVQTSLTVSNLSLSVKLLLDAGIIKTRNVTEVLKMVANNFRTEKVETISEESLRNKSYNIEANSVNALKDILIQLMNQLRKY